jgi:dTMP kinase
MSKSLEGKFIVFEGTDGAGKSTQVNLLDQRLADEGYDTLKIYTPSNVYRNDPLVREYNQSGGGPLSSTTLSIMAAADRLRTVDAEIKPHMSSGGVVVCDRYFYSAAAYFEMRGADISTLREVHSHLLKPDFAILLSIDSVTRAIRLRQRATTNDWEEQDMDYLDTVQQKIQKNWKDNFLTVDATSSIAVIHAEVSSYLEIE